jgi:hypothetical protein
MFVAFLFSAAMMAWNDVAHAQIVFDDRIATPYHSKTPNNDLMQRLLAYPTNTDPQIEVIRMNESVEGSKISWLNKKDDGCKCKDEGGPKESSISGQKHDRRYLWWNLFWCIICLGCVAVISGLFLGLLTLDPLDLQIILKVSISEDEKEHAAKLLPLVKQHHLVLVTLLLMNGIAYETLPIFMGNLVPTYVAIVLSVTLVLFFGEILPSAYFTGPDQLELATKLAPIMRVSLILFYPVAFPLSKVLDYIVHEGGEAPNASNKYNRDELSALIRIQHEERMTSKHRRGPRKPVHKYSYREETPDSSWRALKREIMEAVDARQVEDNYVDDTVPDPQEQMNPPLRDDEVNMVEGACLQLHSSIS